MHKILSAAAIEALRATDPEAASAAQWARSSSPAARRLDSLKRKAAESVATILKNWPAGEARNSYAKERGDWRSHRYPRRFTGGRWQPAEEARRPDERAFYVDAFDSDLGLREIGRADNVATAAGYPRSIEHSGWYTREEDYGETVAGYVLQLPARNGKPVYIPGIAWTDCDGVTLYPLDQYEEPLDAAKAADGIAERVAEESREYDSAWQLGSRYARLGEELEQSRKAALELMAEMKPLRRAADGPPAICSALRAQLQGFINEARDARKERAELRGEAESLSSWDRARRRELQGAFNEGAGESVVKLELEEA